MKFHYPNGKKYTDSKSSAKKPKIKQVSYSNRGMTLEEDINETNEYYLVHRSAVIHKKPTPVQIVDVHYPARSAAVIKEAYFKQPSTTDYNGVYKGRYIDFEAKETKNKTSFPLQNFHEHQIKHMSDCVKQNGICFVILRFTTLDEMYFLEAKHLLTFWNRKMADGRKSITKKEVETYGHPLSIGFRPRIDYIKVINQLYFES